MVLIGALAAVLGAVAAMVWLVRRLRLARQQAEAGSRAKSCLRVDPEPRTLTVPSVSNHSLTTLAAEVESRGDRAPDQTPARVLVADDNAINQKVAVRMLKSLGLRADVSANGREAVEMSRTLPYDLVLMDCQMPLMNGQEAAIEIRKREPPERRTPIIAMTAETGADCLDRCLASGMDDILLKPIRMEALRLTVQRWLSANRTSTCIRVAPPGVDLGVEAAPGAASRR